MKKIQTAAVAFSMFSAMLPTAFALVAPATAPSNGFIQTESPEWSSTHQTSVSNISGHRQYHRDAVSDLAQWYTDHAADRGTYSYNFARRIVLQKRNLLHRLYHMGLTFEDTQSTSSFSSSYSSYVSSSSSSSVTSSSSSSSLTMDTVRPSIVSTTPADQMGNVPLNSVISVMFSENMKGATLTDATFILSDSSGRVSGRVAMNGASATLTPTNPLSANTMYKITIISAVSDLAGNTISREYTSTFTTGQTVSNTHQASVALGAASTFAVLAGSTVTNTGPTSISGDLGVSAGTAVTGFAPGIVTNGSIHSADTLAGQAQSALTIAYNDIAGRSTAPVSIAGNIGGMTLSPGLYKSTSGLEISSGDLTLDAKGDSNAIFIFQIASTLNVSTGRHVVLIGGAKAANVFWQVGTSANLEANSVFKGSILADQSISLQTGAMVDGRLLARIGGVTLQGNTVTVSN